MAELWKLPVVYVIENNRYAMGTSVNRASAQTDFSRRGLSFNIPGEQVDGMDVAAVQGGGRRAPSSMRARGKGPYILEMLTYRYRGHSMSDPAKYRSQGRGAEDAQGARPDRAEPRAPDRLSTACKEDELKAIDAEIREIVNDAAEFATNDPGAGRRELWTDILQVIRRTVLHPPSGRRTARAEATMPDILMPALSPTMEEGKLAKWLKKEGDTVKSGDVIAEIETDKATMEVEAVDEGVLAEILVPEGTDNVAVNTPIAVIRGEGEAAPVPPPAAAQAGRQRRPVPPMTMPGRARPRTRPARSRPPIRARCRSRNSPTTPTARSRPAPRW